MSDITTLHVCAIWSLKQVIDKKLLAAHNDGNPGECLRPVWFATEYSKMFGNLLLCRAPYLYGSCANVWAFGLEIQDVMLVDSPFHSPLSDLLSVASEAPTGLWLCPGKAWLNVQIWSSYQGHGSQPVIATKTLLRLLWQSMHGG